MSTASSHRKSSVRWFAVLMTLTLVASVVLSAGCAPTTAPATSAPAATAVPATKAVEPTVAPVVAPTEEPTVAPTEAATATECKPDWTPTYPPAQKYDPPVEISAPFSASYDFTSLPGDDILNNPMYNRIVDQLGIKYKIAWQADGNEYYTRLSNDLAGGTLPDVFRVKNPLIGQFVDPGAVEDITDIWEKTASDLTKQKKGYPDHPIWQEVTRDGRIYGIAYKEDGLGDDSLALIRQDWLDQVKMDAPKTLEEFTAVAKAFKDAGLSEYPIAINQNLVTWDFGVDPVFGAFGVIPAGGGPGYWLKDADGKLIYSSIQPGAKEALAVLHSWFKDGLIDPDFLNQDESAASDKFVAGTIGIAFQPWWSAHANVSDLYAAFPEAKITVIANPIGPDGTSGRAGTLMKGQGVLFRKGVDPKIIEAFIKQMNWQIDMHANWEKYQQYGEYSNSAGFFKGYEWDFDENCQMVPGKVPGGEWVLAKDLLAGYRGMTYPDYPADTFASMAKWLKSDPAKLNMAQKFIIEDPNVKRDIEYYNTAIASRSEIIENQFKGRNTEAINEVLPDLLDFEKSAFLEFITGARSLDDFDKFVAEWLERGGKVYTEEVNKWAAENK